MALLVLAVLGILAYLLSLKVYPNVRCRACDGLGEIRSKRVRRLCGPCGRCEGTGRRPRWGTRLGGS